MHSASARLSSFEAPLELPEKAQALPLVQAVFEQLAFASVWLFVFSVAWEEEIAIPGIGWVSRIFGAAALGAVLGAVVIRQRLRPLWATHYIMAAFVCWVCASSIWTLAPDWTAERIGAYLQLAIMAWLIWETATTRVRAVALVRAFVLGTLISSGSTILNFLNGEMTKHAGDNRATGRFTAGHFNENELGLLLALSVPMSAYLAAQSRRPLHVLLYWAQILMVFTAIVLSASRGAFIAVCVSLLSIPLSFLGLARWKRIGYLSMAAAGLIVSQVLIPASSWNRLSGIQAEVSEGTLTKRTVAWHAGLEVFRDHPFLGVGSGAFGPAVASRVNRAMVAHNVYISVLVELGVVGIAILILLLAGMLLSALQLPYMERRMWMVLLLSWGIGVTALTWEHRKPTWLLYALMPVFATACQDRSPRAHS